MSTVSKNKAKLISIDWGTTNRIGYLLDQNGNILETRRDDLGLRSITQMSFREAFYAMADPWAKVNQNIPALLSGMVGASTGWLEAPYCKLPIGEEDLARVVKKVPSNDRIWIVPGIACYDNNGLRDVIRGEEVQAIAASKNKTQCTIIVPGTHSKWIKVSGKKIIWFSTFITGELHSILLNHSIISDLLNTEQSHDLDSFFKGVKLGFYQNKKLTHILFSARTLALFKDLDSKHISGYLSGLLIGAELSSAFEDFHSPPKEVVLVGRQDLCLHYQKALALFGVKTSIDRLDHIGKVYSKIAEYAGLLESKSHAK